MRRAIAVMTLCASVSLLAQPGAGDLWVGVLVFDTGPGGMIYVRSSVRVANTFVDD